MAKTPKFLTVLGHDRYGNDRSMIALTIPLTMRAQLVALALTRRTSLSEVVRQFVQRGLDAHDERSHN